MSEYLVRACACIFLLVSFAIQGCKEDDQPEIDPSVYPISIEVTPELGGNRVTWSEVNTRDFERYWVIRSLDSLEDDVDIADLPGAVAGQVDQPEDTELFDVVPPQGRVVYYKVLAELGGRFLISPTISVSRNINGLSVRYGDAVFDPEHNTLFVKGRNDGLVSAVNYMENRFLGIISIGNNNQMLAAGAHKGQSELYVYISNSPLLTIYPANDLANPESHTFLRNIGGVAAGNNGLLYVGHSDNEGTFRAYRREGFGQQMSFTGGRAFAQKSLAMFPRGSNNVLDVTTQFVELYSFDDNGNFISRKSQSVSGSTAFINPLAVHPTGEYFIAFSNGIVLDKDLKTVTVVGGNQNSSYAFSPDGSRLYFSSLNTLNVIDIPSFQVVETLRTGISVRKIFVDDTDQKLLLIGDASFDNTLQAVVEVLPLP